MSAVPAVAALVLAAVLCWPRPTSARLRALGPGGPEVRGGRPHRWRSAPGQREEPGVPLLLDLVAAVVQAGAAPAAALTAVADAVGGPDGEQLRTVGDRLRLGAADPVAWAGTSSHLLPLRRALELATAAGAPVVVLLQEAADAQRRELQRHAAVAAARLGVRTVLPVGLCALPAFVLLGVAPVVLGLGGALLGAP